MGFDTHGIEFLIAAAQKGAINGNVLTLGRQGLYDFDKRYLAKRLRRVRKDLAEIITDRDTPELGSAEPLLRKLGAKNISSVDIFPDDCPTFILNLNYPLPEDMERKYDTVVDGGCLEHVYNFPVALENAMRAVKEGGHLLIYNICNNMSGHGFYQFSPEAFLQMLSAKNGFEMQSIWVCERSSRKWYNYNWRYATGRRVEFRNHAPTYLAVIARRERAGKISFDGVQSDYSKEICNSKNESDGMAEMSKTKNSVRASMIRRVLFPKMPLLVLRLHLAARGFSSRRFPSPAFTSFDIYKNIITPAIKHSDAA